ncbi:MAG: signal peptidase II [Chitinivibrionales bacterium]
MNPFKGRSKWFFLVGMTLPLLFLDWLTKFLAVRYLQYGRPVPVIGDFFELCLVYNKGALFGLDPSDWISGFPVNKFFFIFSIIAILVLVIYYRYLKEHEYLTITGVALLFPGALGNILDRLINPGRGVVDFLKIGVSRDIYWPIFNFADIYITLGIIIVIIDIQFFSGKTGVPESRVEQDGLEE